MTRAAQAGGASTAGAPTLGQRLAQRTLKPAPEAPPAAPPSRAADDRERLVGLIAAPLAAAIGFLVVSALVGNDPATGPRHVSVSLYEEVLVALLALAVAMLAGALLRKRLALGMVTALYGLAIFNLHYWGFGLPFVMAGAWLLVRAYRRHRANTEPVVQARAARPSHR